MTRRVYLHVGTPKSGTTYLQGVLAANRDRLAAAGVAVLGQSHLDLVHAGMVVREDPRLERLPPRAREAWSRVVAQAHEWSGESAVVSYELLAGATPEQAARAVADLAPAEVHVVVTARDFARALPSAWQERLKFALATPLEEWTPPPDTEVRSEWGWRTLDPAGVVRRWRGDLPVDRLHLVTMPPAGRPEQLWRRFADACGIGGIEVRTASQPANTSLGAGPAEVLRRVNELVGDPVTGSREQSVWLRDTLAHQILAPLDQEPIGLTDEQYAAAQARAAESLAYLASSGVTWHGSAEDLAPRRPFARTPGEVPASELLDVAVQAIWALLLELRSSRRAQREQALPADRGSRARAVTKNLVLGTYARRAQEATDTLAERVAELEEQLASARQLEQRLAAVTDVVEELLLPGLSRDAELLRRAVAAYRLESM